MFFDGEKYMLGAIDNNNIDMFLGDYTCTISHPEIVYSDTAVTKVERCGKSQVDYVMHI